MSGGIYGGDEIGALVVDVGSCTLRAGYAGEDMPKVDMPTCVGVVSDAAALMDSKPSQLPSAASESASRDLFVGTNQLFVPRKGMEVKSYLKDGMVENWDMFEDVLSIVFKSHIREEATMRPILMSEPSWNEKSKREKLTELMFEKFGTPGFFLVKTPVLTCFANGRSTALVFDSGATHMSATPVHDGYVLSQASVKSPLGGDFITMQCRQLLEEKKIDLTPACMIGSKKLMRDNEVPNPDEFRKKNLPELTKSFHTAMVKTVIQDFQQCVVQCSEQPYDQQSLDNIPAYHYEFPNGYHCDFASERFRIAETLFDPAVIQLQHAGGGPAGAAMTGASTMLSASHITTTAAGMCDPDLRQSLYNNIVVTGGNTLLNGFADRLTNDLLKKTPPNMKLKLIHPPSSAERRFSAWVGGSILASLGSFQQLWVSKQDYGDGGKGCIERKCP